HAHEQASFEASAAARPDPMKPEKPLPPPPDPPPPAVVVPAEKPAQYRPGRGSRLVFALPEGGTIDFTTTGILGALPWLDAVLHPRGEAPGTRPPRYELPSGRRIDVHAGIEVALGNGLFAVLRDEGVLITKRGNAGTAVPDPVSVFGMARLAANERLVADVIRARGVTVGRGIDRATLPGRVGDLLDPRIPPIVRRGTYSRKASLDETAIEAPFRLQLSPTSQGHWVHASQQVPADDAPGHVELWHTRLDTGERTGQDLLRPTRAADDETRVVRAVWARDRDDLTTAEWRSFDVDQSPNQLSPDDVTSTGVAADPFLGSLDRADRHRIVRQTSEVWPGKGSARLEPTPVGAEKLWLTSLGAWLELHGQWVTKPYSEAFIASVLAWDHIATAGRDQFVRVVYPGYLYPLGQPTVRVKITERSIRPTTNPTAGLFQRQFLVVIDPVRTHSTPGFHLSRTELRPLVTPSLDPPGDDVLPGLGSDKAFWPRVGGKSFAFRVASVDRDGRPGTFDAPLLWVAEHVGTAADLKALDDGYRKDPRRVIDLGGQTVAFVTKEDAGDARLETQRVRLLGRAAQGRSTPRLSSADVVLPAAQAIAGTGPTHITYYAPYRKSGFTGSNTGRVWAATVTGEITGSGDYDADLVVDDAPVTAQDKVDVVPRIGFGGQPGDVGSDNAGGFVQPSLTIAGLSMRQGPVGDLAQVATGQFDPATFLGAALPKLFGLVELKDLLPKGTLDEAPSLITDALDTLSAIEKEVQRAVDIAADAVAQAQRVLDKVQGTAGDAQAAAQQLLDDARDLAQAYVDLAAALPGIVSALAGLDADTVTAAIDTPVTGLRARLTTARDATRTLSRPPMPLFSRTRLDQVAEALDRFAASTDLVGDIVGLLQGLELAKKEVTFRYEWTPTMRSWPSEALPLIHLEPDSLVLAVHGTLKASGPPSVEVLAELRNFQLNLFAKDPLIQIPFERLSFKAGSSGKAEVDVVMDDIVFGGFLSFIETVKELIPLDGFSDPPSVEVTPAGLTAGFSLELPNLAIGVFSLSNMSLGADVRVPFLGETITVGFNFCTRERPFVLAVVFLGGGGWFLVRLSPKGLEVLELGLEAGAYLAVDFGVASGSISAAIGIYIRLEGEKGSLTGYFRLRGEVDVLGLISASIELYMELVYNFDTGKMIGRARITVEVEVLCFSASVTIEAERQFAGSNGDPSLREVVMEADGTAPAWDDYLLAFAPEEVAA
ncbi:MAG TPA: hypothetical protein VES93_09120, partial [Ornithinibacter sp.]|nr:hypothetical protein [Ornithinibacter sp.]